MGIKTGGYYKACVLFRMGVKLGPSMKGRAQANGARYHVDGEDIWAHTGRSDRRLEKTAK